MTYMIFKMMLGTYISHNNLSIKVHLHVHTHAHAYMHSEGERTSWSIPRASGLGSSVRLLVVVLLVLVAGLIGVRDEADAFAIVAVPHMKYIDAGKTEVRKILVRTVVRIHELKVDDPTSRSRCLVLQVDRFHAVDMPEDA